MKLKKVHITNFRSVEDSTPFTLEAVTSLVGKNEAGKSAVLLALAALNPHPSTPVALDKERDYPRRLLTNYAERHPKEAAVAVTTTWLLEPSEIQAIEAELGKGVLPSSNEITVLRRYGAKEAEWIPNLNLKVAIDHALTAGKFDDAQLAALRAAGNTAELIEKLSKLPDPTPEQTKLKERLNSYGSFTSRVAALLKPHFPQFMYFSNYDRMDGAVQLELLKAMKADGRLEQDPNSGARLFSEFLEYAGIPIDDILNVNTYETFNARLQAASNSITDQILEYWAQNPDLMVQVTVSPAKTGDPAPFNAGTIGRARIYNQLHRADTPFSERSAGFVWFFSFLIKFAQVKKQGHPVVLLLDEPGLTLHGKAQADLLRYFDEKLAPHHQIVYTTHSPFMIAPDKLMSARLVEDKIEIKNGRRLPLGTKVSEDVLATDSDTIFPLQGALGYEITQSLFVGKHTLLVEGVSDILYLQALSAALKARGRVGLDPKWTICPSGGIGNVKAFVSLFGGNKLDIAVLADNTKKDAKKLEELKRSDVLKTERVFTVSDFTGKPESDIEDIFEPSVFVEIVNSAYALSGKHALTVDTLDTADTATVRLVKKAEAAFRVLPSDMPVYDHFTPSAWLIQHPVVLEATSAPVNTTLDRAEELFKLLNASLK